MGSSPLSKKGCSVSLQAGIPDELIHADVNQNLGKHEWMKQLDTELLQEKKP